MRIRLVVIVYLILSRSINSYLIEPTCELHLVAFVTYALPFFELVKADFHVVYGSLMLTNYSLFYHCHSGRYWNLH